MHKKHSTRHRITASQIRIRRRWIWWSAAAAFIAFTYATLGVMPGIWKKINAFFGGKGVVVQYSVYATIWLALIYYIIFVKRERSPFKYLLFTLFILLFLAAVKLEKYPGEKIHMAQYGLLGVILYNALRIDFNRYDRRLYLWGAAICAAAGALDEVIQYFLPNRFFTWHDVFINGISGIVMLYLIRYNILKEKKVPISHDGRAHRY